MLRKSRIFFVGILIACSVLKAHNPQLESSPARLWQTSSEGQQLKAWFCALRGDKVYLESENGKLVTLTYTQLSSADKQYVDTRQQKINSLNNYGHHLTVNQPKQETPKGMIYALTLVLALGGVALLYFAKTPVSKLLCLLVLCGVSSLIIGFAPATTWQIKSNTSVAFLDSAFAPFKPKISTYTSSAYYYVESLGMAEHTMMAGITNWQQQVPIPQCYIGSNAWPIPLNPVVSNSPIAVNQSHFTRGAIAVAINGVPIFNPYTNTGVDAFLDGQLDNYGGHSGRADDYHYHIAPLSLYSQTSATLPIAFGFDGFAIYGSKEPNGSAMTALDANHGHVGSNGVYHYHGTTTAPYMIGNMVGQVTEDATNQIIPQAQANAVRPGQNPLSGAVITNLQANGSNGYTLTYSLTGQTYQVNYNWNSAGQYNFIFISPTNSTTQTYTATAPCKIVAGISKNKTSEEEFLIYPNPAKEGFNLKQHVNNSFGEIKSMSVYSMDGRLISTCQNNGTTLETGALAKGVYLINILINNTSVTKKLIIE